MPDTGGGSRRTGRRRVLKIIGAGCGSTLCSTAAIAGDPQEHSMTDQIWDLLPADEADVLEPVVNKELSNPEEMMFDTYHTYAEAFDAGFLQVGTAGDLGGGEGELAIDGAAWVESEWQPPERDEYKATATYEHSASQGNDTLQTDSELVLSSQANLAVIDADTDTIVAQQSALGQNELTAEMQEVILENLLTRIATYILFPQLGLVGRALGRFLVGPAIDQLIEIEPYSSGPLIQSSIPLRFQAAPNSTYRIRFTTNNGFSGQTRDTDEFFMAHSSSFFELTEFTVEPTIF